MPHEFDHVTWNLATDIEEKVAEISPLTAEVVYYAAREALRNAAKHGRISNNHPLQITMRIQWANGLILHIEDNGAGLQAPLPNQHKGGAGQGLNLHTSMLAVVGGQLTLESSEGNYTRVVIYIPAASLFLRQ